MTGVQTCALPICFPVTIQTNYTILAKNITSIGGPIYTPLVQLAYTYTTLGRTITTHGEIITIVGDFSTTVGKLFTNHGNPPQHLGSPIKTKLSPIVIYNHSDRRIQDTPRRMGRCVLHDICPFCVLTNAYITFLTGIQYLYPLYMEGIRHFHCI